MKVRDIIKQLQRFNPEMEIKRQTDSDGGWEDFKGFEVGLLNTNEENGLYTQWSPSGAEYLTRIYELDQPCFESVLIITKNKNNTKQKEHRGQ
jgi:hypothetical protein